MPEVWIKNKATGEVVGRRRSRSGEYPERAEVEYVTPGKRWEKPTQTQTVRKIKQQRNKLLDAAAWTVRKDSPLSAESKQEWLRYMKQLHRVTKDLVDPAAATWPVPPELVFDQESEV